MRIFLGLIACARPHMKQEVFELSHCVECVHDSQLIFLSSAPWLIWSVTNFLNFQLPQMYHHRTIITSFECVTNSFHPSSTLAAGSKTWRSIYMMQVMKLPTDSGRPLWPLPEMLSHHSKAHAFSHACTLSNVYHFLIDIFPKHVYLMVFKFLITQQLSTM